MKKINVMLCTMLLAFGAVSCSNNTETEGAIASNELTRYVDSVDAGNQEFKDENWAVIDAGYHERALVAEAKLAKMTEEDKAKVEASNRKYAELSAKYQEELAKRTSYVEGKVRLRNALFGEGKVGVDMSFSFANAGNLLSIYETFVDAVIANKDTYTREDWDEIKLLYEALDTRKNELEKDLPSGDNRKIAAKKVKFAVVLDLNRPGSKAQENADAKS